MAFNRSTPPSIGAYIRQKRIEQDLTQDEVATYLGYGTPQFISNIERNLARPPVDALQKLISLLKLNVNTTVDLYLLPTKNKILKAFKSHVKEKLDF